MATSLELYAPFDSGAGANVMEDTWRRFMKYMLDSGPLANVLNEFQVYADSSGMQVKVKTGECWIQGHWGYKSTETTLAIASNSSGSTRIDRAVLRADFTNNRIELDVLTGTTSAPAVTQSTSIWEISLAQVSVSNGAVTIAAGNVTDERLIVSPLRNPPRALVRQTSTQTLTTGVFADVTFTAEDFDTANGHSTSSNTARYTAQITGEYLLSGGVAFDFNGSGARCVQWAKNGSAIAASDVGMFSAGAGLATRVPARTIEVHLNVGDYVTLQAFQDSGGNLNTFSSGAAASSMYVLYIGR